MTKVNPLPSPHEYPVGMPEDVLGEPGVTDALGGPGSNEPAELSSGGRPWSMVMRVALPLIAIGFFLFLWNEVPLWLGFHTYEVPTFSQDIEALKSQWGLIGPNLKITILDALAGFIVGNLLAVVGAIFFTQSKYIEWTFFPLAILVQTIPIIVIAPIFVVIFTVESWDQTGVIPYIGNVSKPILAVTILITFFPTLVNMTVGLRAIDPNLYDFMRLINASRWTILWRLRLPSSMPFLFSSFKITSTLCFVGAVVGEWMLAAQTGIGGLLNVFNFEQDKTGLWASVIAVSLSSMIFFGLVVVAERVLIPWRQER